LLRFDTEATQLATEIENDNQGQISHSFTPCTFFGELIEISESIFFVPNLGPNRRCILCSFDKGLFGNMGD